MKKIVEYRVRPVTRFIVTRFEREAVPHCTAQSCTQRGEFDNSAMAHQIAYALCRLEHDLAGTPPDDTGFIYPGPMEAAESQTPSNGDTVA